MGIVLVVYGHLIENLFQIAPGTPLARLALPQWQVIYAFHMPLFFFLAGVSHGARRDPPGRAVAGFLRRFWYPSIAFGLVALPLAVLRDGDTSSLWLFVRTAALGHGPVLVVTWFLVCLGLVKILHAVCGPLASRAPLLAIALAYGAGAALSVVLDISAIAWHIRPLFIAWAFFLLGIGRRRAVVAPGHRLTGLALAASAAVLLAGFGWNTGCPLSLDCRADNLPGGFGVFFISGVIGNLAVFPIVAVAGISATTAAARLLAGTRAGDGLAVLGRLSLELFILNGFCLMFVNRPLVLWLGKWLEAWPGDGGLWPMQAAVAAATVLSLLATLPLARLIRRHGQILTEAPFPRPAGPCYATGHRKTQS
jgi:fucose 4-O-acetylase-like acetyltransferase